MGRLMYEHFMQKHFLNLLVIIRFVLEYHPSPNSSVKCPKCDNFIFSPCWTKSFSTHWQNYKLLGFLSSTKLMLLWFKNITSLSFCLKNDFVYIVMVTTSSELKLTHHKFHLWKTFKWNWGFGYRNSVKCTAQLYSFASTVSTLWSIQNKLW